MTVIKGFGVWVDAENYYIGTAPNFDCRTHPEILSPQEPCKR